MQAASAFTIVQTAFNWLVDNYPRLADWAASARRVASLAVSIDALEEAEKRVLIAGESGTGKSTLVRAIAGLWPWGGGRIEVRRGARIFFLPQRSYVPTGTLRRAAN